MSQQCWSSAEEDQLKFWICIVPGRCGGASEMWKAGDSADVAGCWTLKFLQTGSLVRTHTRPGRQPSSWCRRHRAKMTSWASLSLIGGETTDHQVADEQQDRVHQRRVNVKHVFSFYEELLAPT
jgi:hypothetical protein